MDVLHESQSLMEVYHLIRVQFIDTELELGITFCRVARATGNSETRERNIGNAQRAYKTAQAGLENSSMARAAREVLTDKLSFLREELAECGEL